MRNTIKIRLLLIGLTMLAMAAVKAQTFCNCNIAIDNSFQIAPMTRGIGTDVGVAPLYQNNNASTPALALPFNFCFYNHSFDSVFISNNGIVSFIKPIYSFIDSPATVPLGTDTLIIAPFWADANTNNNGGKVYYKITPTYMVVIWDSVRYSGIDVDGWNTFQLIISDGADPILPTGDNISFCYPEMEWACSDSSGGFSGYGGTPAFVGINKGDGVSYAQISTFALPGTVYNGPFSGFNGVDWLNFQSFTFSSCVNGNVIAPVICNNLPDCNKLYICPCDTSETESAYRPDSLFSHHCDTVNMTAAFLCAQQGQTATLSYACTGALNITSAYTNTSGIFDSIIITAIPAFGDSGTHELTLTATDTVNHVQSTVTYTIDVTKKCLTAGIEEAQATEGFTVYPNPVTESFIIGYNQVSGIAGVKIYNLVGAEVFSNAAVPDKTELSIAGLGPGVYFVELIKNGFPLATKKIVRL